MNKTDIYHTLYELNAAFAQAVIQCRKLQQAGLFKAKAVKLFPSFVQELQAEINSEVLNPLHSIEQADWAHHGKIRQQWEKYLRDPESKPRRKAKQRQ